MGSRRTKRRCEVCGHERLLTFEVLVAGARHVFDSFECAIHKMAPLCGRCGCKVIGHGIEADGHVYCCSDCARMSGAQKVRA